MPSGQLPILPVLVPLVCAPLCAVLTRGRLAWGVACAASWATLALAALLLAEVAASGPVSYAIGGWPPPWGIEYRVDLLGGFVLLLVCAIAAATSSYARLSVEREIPIERTPLFYSTYLLCLTGLLGIAATGDAFNLFVFLEISSLSSYALIAMARDRRALTAAFQYLIMGTIGATFILIGVGFLYMMTGTLNMLDLAQRLPAVSDTRTVHAALAFLVVGISLKLALFPLHLWLPGAYTHAPSVVTAFLAATATKVALYMLLRFVFTVFGAGFSFEVRELDVVLLPLAALAVLSGSLVAIFQDNVKRMLAYSSLAQIGYMTLGFSLGTVTGVTASIVHLFNHAFIKGGLFLALGCVVYRLGSSELRDLAGIGKRMPWTMAAFVGGGLSLVGLPLTSGFISKWYLVLGALEKGWWPVAAVILAGSLLALVYIWRVVEVAYFRAADNENVSAGAGGEAPWSLLLPTWALIAANIYFGIDTRLNLGVARHAAAMLLGTGP